MEEAFDGADIVYPVSNRALFRDTEDNTGHAPHTA